MDELVGRTAKAMVAEGMPYRGVIFAGLMIKNGKVRTCLVRLVQAMHCGPALLRSCRVACHAPAVRPAGAQHAICTYSPGSC
jgi:hypothetical protein